MNKTPLIFLTLVGSTAIAGDEWESYSSDEYGFSMLIPEGTKPVEKEAGGGWGGLYAKADGVELYGLAKLAVQASPEEIEKFAVKETGIPDDKWTKVDEGKGENGFKWYRVYKAKHAGKIVFGAAGTGPKGSYLIFLRTTESDFNAHKADYESWYESVKVF
jgi:hypothetical protein